MTTSNSPDSTAFLQLPIPPEDTVSRLVFDETSKRLAVASWDARVKIYNVPENKLIADYAHVGPVLDCCFVKATEDSFQICSVGIDQNVYLFHSKDSSTSTLGKHQDCIKCVNYCKKRNLVFTASYDKVLNVWNPDLGKEGSMPLRSLTLPEKPHAMDLSADKLVIACDNRLVLLVDIDTFTIVQQRESSLKHPTRNVVCFPDNEAYCTSSVEGRVSIDYFDEASNKEKRYAFKCHRRMGDDGDVEYVYPVNALAAYPKHATFATGGSDGSVSIWNRDTKRRLRAIPKGFSTTVAQLAFSADGRLLAVADSYVFDQGEVSAPKHTVFLLAVDACDVDPTVNKK